MTSASTSTTALKRVLLVDDEVALLRVTARILARDGYHVTCARSGPEASKELAEHAFDVVVSDVHMPGMNGLQLMRVLREHDPDVQFVLVTGHPDLASAAAAVEFGAFLYLTKPVAAPELCRSVDLAIAATRAARLEREFIESCGSGTYRVGDRASVEAVLDRALSSLWVAYQPVVAARTLIPLGCEALTRTDEPGLRQPLALLNAAQRTKRLPELGRIVRGRVAAELLQDSSEQTLCFINVHSEDLLDPQLLSRQSALSWFASRVVLEVTERESLTQVAGLVERVASLRTLGYRIALDDLGAGYAGLSSFAQLDPDFVKLDSSLVRDVHESAIKRRLIRAMVELCHDMGKQVIAEGVETIAERTLLEGLGCDLLQGDLFTKPVRGLAAALHAAQPVHSTSKLA